MDGPALRESGRFPRETDEPWPALPTLARFLVIAGRKPAVQSLTGMPPNCFFSVSVALLATGLVPLSASDVILRSGPKPVSLIELYTSEGCSSCPPAEKWLGELRSAPGLWRDFVPVAFHVNYWDHLGWRDPLASKAFTQRQHAYADAWRSRSVYTPCFVRDGTEWRPTATAPARDRNAGSGMLVLQWQPELQRARVEFIAPAQTTFADAWDVNVAVLGGGIVSAVQRGENAGRNLRHEFVVLGFAAQPLTRDTNGVWTATLDLDSRADVAAPRRAVAAWINPRGRLAPVQAVGGWLE
jgi:hypothetical protein